MHHAKEPGEAHQSLMRGLRAVVEQHGANGMPGVERIAVMAQLIGQEVANLPANVPYGSAELLHAIAANIEQGNRTATGATASNLLGFGGQG